VFHFKVTEHPTAAWTAQHLVEAFPWDTAPCYLLRDRDAIHGACLRQPLGGMGVKEVLIARHSPWQNPSVERLIGSIRRECLDHVAAFSENHLRRILSEYLSYCHHDRTHCALGKAPPLHRPVDPRPAGPADLAALPRLGGLHHRYEWRKAA
jgi:transposase InsO family protein